MCAAAKGDTKEMEATVEVRPSTGQVMHEISHFCCYNIFLVLCLFVSDIDECSIGSADCGPGADCINLNGSFACQCQVGYQKFGNNCTGAENITIAFCLCTLQFKLIGDWLLNW